MIKKTKILIDTDVFVIDLRYHRDPKYSENKAFLEHVRQGRLEGLTTLYNLMEVCGILSFNLSSKSLRELFIGFAERYTVKILFPSEGEGEICFDPVRVMEVIERKLSFGDALITELAERYRRRFDLFVTWNVAHFEGKLPLRVVTPAQMKEL